MIKFLTIKNFQRHQKLRVRLGRITTLLGPTDSGKSAILRALRWLALNNLPGDDFIRNGAKSALVKIKLENGAWIGRGKGKANLYALNGKKFRSFGQDVPAPVKQVLRMDAINFQRQHDSPFWFAESAGQVSRELNRVVDLGIIDTSLARAASLVRTAETNKNVQEGRLREITEALKDSQAVETRIHSFSLIEKLHEKTTKLTKAQSRLDKILADISSHDTANLKSRADECHELARRGKRLWNLREQTNQLDCLIREIEGMPELENRSSDAQEISTLGQQLDQLSSCRGKLSHLVERILAEKLALDAAHARCEGALNRMRKIKYCPLCRRKL